MSGISHSGVCGWLVIDLFYRQKIHKSVYLQELIYLSNGFTNIRADKPSLRQFIKCIQSATLSTDERYCSANRALVYLLHASALRHLDERDEARLLLTKIHSKYVSLTVRSLFMFSLSLTEIYPTNFTISRLLLRWRKRSHFLKTIS